ncbi:hypothetical protein ABIB40_002832 [Pedobacter sp. UYP30]|uniref:hypothetical protein n=1 Tax=Pedobacter sp. UYP30 TaxID=1756400 RepID=UPI00339461E8
MKKSLSLMLLAVMLTFASCKKIINPEPEKEQTCILTGASDSDGGNIKIDYDDNGRVVTYAYVDGDYTETTTYTYSTTQILEKYVLKDVRYNSSYQENYKLDGSGRIVSSTNGTIPNQTPHFKYNN